MIGAFREFIRYLLAKTYPHVQLHYVNGRCAALNQMAIPIVNFTHCLLVTFLDAIMGMSGNKFTNVLPL